MDNQSNINSSESWLTDEKLDIEKYWRMIKARLHIVIIVTLAVLAAAYVKISTSPPIYQATGLLMIEPESRNIIMFDNTRASMGWRNEYFNTQIEILQSRTLAKEVKEGFDSSIGNDPEKGGKELIIRGPFVEPLEFTRLVRVSYRSTDAEAAAQMVNLLFEKFREFNLDLRIRSPKKAVKYIEDQKNKLQQNLAQKEKEMQEYGKRKELFSVSRGDSVVVEKFSDLNKAYTETQIDRINKEAIYQELQGMSYENFPQVKASPLIGNLKNKYSALESEYRRKSQVFRSSYPEMTQLQSQMDSLKQQIREETGDIARKSLNEAKSDYQSSKKKEEALLKMLNQQKQTMVDSDTDAIYYKSLGIEVENMRTLLNFLVRKGEESALSSRVEGLESLNIKIIDKAEVPRRPIGSGAKKIMIMALILGLALGIGLIFLVDYLDRTIKTPDEVKLMLGVPALGIIPSTKAKSLSAYYYSSYYKYGDNKKKGKNNPGPGPKNPPEIELINFVAPESPFAENYRTIRTSILLSVPKEPPEIISITSALSSEGKTVTTINLAVSFSQLGKKVLIIDGDMRKPRMHKIFKIANSPGLSSFLAGRAQVKEIFAKTNIPNLFVVPSGPHPPNPTELISSEVMSMLLSKLRQKVDFIFIDTPPLVGIVDPILLSKNTDGTILVTWAGKTHRHAIEKAKEELDRYNIRTLGVVLNRAAGKERAYGYYSSYYQYKYKDEPEN
ncbi:MAG: polysaccharide biosynthesis tyrosine autokinase [Candidatus Aminicenantes bacterium]|nr:MAG: polysaccharide biosynthesis tyrosine autokinase [Candidatus Aminicenantes bacterium]